MKRRGEIWCVVVSEDDRDYTAPCADRDSAVAYVHENMNDLLENCGDSEEYEKFKSLTEAQRLDYVSRVFERSYEITLRGILSRETPVTQLAEAVDEGDS